MSKGVCLTVNASGAVAAAMAGKVVVIVDVIDMSTTAEAAIDAGAKCVLGGSTDSSRAPVKMEPGKVGLQAGELAIKEHTGVILISEPRVGTEEERRTRSAKVISGIEQSGASLENILPNLGAETVKLADLSGKVVVIVSDTGGVAFDAALAAGAPAVVTGTIARTMQKRGTAPAEAAAERAIAAARLHDTGIAVVAASGNSLEDVLAAEYIMKAIISKGFAAIR